MFPLFWTPELGCQMVDVPLGAALLAVALLCGVGWVAVHEASTTVQRDAQTRVQVQGVSMSDPPVRGIQVEPPEFTSCRVRVVVTARADAGEPDDLAVQFPDQRG